MKNIEETIKELEKYFNENGRSTLYKFVLTEIEKPLIENILHKTKGNQLKAAKIMGINRNTLHSKIKKLGIELSKCKEN